MLKGSLCTVRHLLTTDLNTFIALVNDLPSRGDHFSLHFKSPETLRKKLRKFEQSNIDQVILLNQAGRNSHEDICASLELFAKDVMPEFHAAETEHADWKRKVMAREIVLEELDVQKYDIYSHQNEHIVRLTPEQLKAKMAEKEKARSAGD